METFSIRVSKDSLVFCAAHFITYGGGCCETLHGHNYRVGVTLEGAVDRHALVYDFLEVEARLEELVDRLDHRTLLPDGNHLLELSRDDGGVTVRYEDREYRFPEEDVVILPVPNTTAEMLASYLTDELLAGLSDREGVERLTRVEMEVEESFGQSSVHTRDLAASAGAGEGGSGTERA